MQMRAKKFFAMLLTGALLFAAPVAVSAAPEDEGAPINAVELNALAKEIADQYGVNQDEVRKSLGEGRFMDDIYSAAMLAKLSGKSFATVLSMKQDWFDVMVKLGVTREHWESSLKDMTAADIAQRSNLKKEVVLKLINGHYNPRDIRIAGRLASASKKDVQTVLNMKTINKRWIDVADELKVDRKLIMPRSPMEEEEDKDSNAQGQ